MAVLSDNEIYCWKWRTQGP